MLKGYLCIVLHAHLPFVRHPECPDFLEEDWFYEAVTETYIPLLLVMERLEKEGVDFRLTMSVTPPLANMLSDGLLMERYSNYLKNLETLIEKEAKRAVKAPAIKPAVEMYRQRFRDCRRMINKHSGNLIKAFKYFQDKGVLEIITCTGTHGFLPLMSEKKDRQAQVRAAVADYREKFGKSPRGIWLAECGYTSGVDEILAENGIRYFFTDTHGILYGRPRPKYAVYAPVYCPSGVGVFARDVESSMQVWSSECGYPGDSRYREFYRDIGHDLPEDYIGEHLHQDRVRRNIGIKYYSITGKVALNKKDFYDPAAARQAADEHAGHFLFCRTAQCEHLSSALGKTPLIVSPYDAELYGHWWFEGPEFIYRLFKRLSGQSIIEPVTPSAYLKKHPGLQILSPTPSSWGDKGYNEVWLNASNDWIYRHLHHAARKMIYQAEKNKNASGIRKRALNQMARELLLAESSDWAFIMTTGTMVPYAHKRTKVHLKNFLELEKMLESDNIDGDFLKTCEERNNIFPNIDFRIYI
ncbi:MAG: 1,4-alpha-glucan branching protein domain-containing protein [Candidatus Omnitrophota bacterium]|nr:DUF1957 domain-containing protein [Candidatus Omnitrophota bacterium]MBU2528581.1 DUF1957 domain-containing protein [bacterium]MBU3930339.1 DUF1957 domain-containing protein [bacterium]MBU4123758.1 DUF1957 domain-containing protein [bacterium]